METIESKLNEMNDKITKKLVGFDVIDELSNKINNTNLKLDHIDKFENELKEKVEADIFDFTSTKLESLENKCDNIENTISNISKEVKPLNKLQEHVNRIDKLETYNKRLSVELKTNQNDIQNIEDLHKEEINSKNTKISTLNNTIDELKSKRF